MSRHKWADLIHAWAEGAEIQKFCGDGWYNDSDTPEWFEDCEYRIKPRTVRKEGWVNVCEYNGESRYIGATIFGSKVCAQANKPERWVATVRVEWEEES